MTDSANSARRARHDAIRAEVCNEETEAAEAEAAESSAALLTQAVHRHDSGVLTSAEAEEIARRVAREELQRS